MSNINISDLAGSDFFTTEDSLLTELTNTDTQQIMGGTGYKGGKGKGGSGKGKGRGGSGKSGKGRGGSGKGRGFGGGSSSGRGFDCYCNPYYRT
jgi:hypothetical protein